MMYAKLAIGTVIAAMVSIGAQAASVVPISATGSSSFPGYNDFFAIDQGLGSTTTDWASFSEGVGSTLSLDLGAAYNLVSVTLTDRVTSGGGNGGFVGGTTDFTTSYSLQAFTNATFTTAAGAALVFMKPTPVAPTGVFDFVDTESVAGLNGRFIRYTVLATNGPNPGLSNIVFDGSVVPEPAAWGLMIAGFGIVGVAARRRRTLLAA